MYIKFMFQQMLLLFTRWYFVDIGYIDKKDMPV
jgi:hypothetical protein